jgi:hypothetical protein
MSRDENSRERAALLIIEEEAGTFQEALAARVPGGHRLSSPAMRLASSIEKLCQQRLALTAADDVEVAAILRRASPSAPDVPAPADMATGIAALCAVLELGSAFYGAIFSRAGADLPPFAAKLAEGVWLAIIIESTGHLSAIYHARHRLLNAPEVGRG